MPDDKIEKIIYVLGCISSHIYEVEEPHLKHKMDDLILQYKDHLPDFICDILVVEKLFSPSTDFGAPCRKNLENEDYKKVMKLITRLEMLADRELFET